MERMEREGGKSLSKVNQNIKAVRKNRERKGKEKGVSEAQRDNRECASGEKGENLNAGRGPGIR